MFIGDPNVKLKPCMSPVKRKPFYAIKIFPSDARTKGGLLTDEHSRVLRSNGQAIPGLYVASNVSASMFGNLPCSDTPARTLSTV